MTSSKLLLYKRLLSTLLSQIVIIMIFSWVKTNPYHRHLHQKKVLSLHFFFLSGFLSRTLTTYRTAGERRGPSFILLYHFHPLTNIQTFICNFACEMTIIFLIAPLVFTRLLLDEIYHLIELLFDWLMMWYWFSFVCLLIWF